jgi:hypothetical protein
MVPPVSGSGMSCVPATLSDPSSSFLMYNPLLVLAPLAHPFGSHCARYDKDPVNDAYDLEVLKDFMNEVAYGVNGIEGEDALPSPKGVKQT